MFCMLPVIPQGDLVIGIDDEWAIDGTPVVHDTATFHAVHMNHSRRRYNVLRYTSRAERAVRFFAARDILPEEELLIDYGRNYWRGRQALELD